MANSALVTVTVRVNAPPVVTNDSATTFRNSPVTVNVLANDVDPEGMSLQIASVTQPANGAVTISQGQLVYTPKTGFAGVDTFTYSASDGLATATGTVSVTVVNRAPVAQNDLASTSGTTPVKIAVLANDLDPDRDPLRVVNLSAPANGKVTLNTDGTVTYTANAGFSGVDTFRYKASDGLLESNEVTVSIEVKAQPIQYTNSTKVSLVDGGLRTSTIVISDQYAIKDLNVRLGISHSKVSELQIFLVSPNGTRVQLFDGAKRTANLADATFDDEGVLIPLQALSTFDGMSIRGTWTLEVRDTVKKNSGTLNFWSLIAEP
jgi:subtilisin-like proprotein convertase family protein